MWSSSQGLAITGGRGGRSGLLWGCCGICIGGAEGWNREGDDIDSRLMDSECVWTGDGVIVAEVLSEDILFKKKKKKKSLI